MMDASKPRLLVLIILLLAVSGLANLALGLSSLVMLAQLRRELAARDANAIAQDKTAPQPAPPEDKGLVDPAKTVMKTTPWEDVQWIELREDLLGKERIIVAAIPPVQ